MKKLILLSITLISFICNSQNLVSNGGFENWPVTSSPEDWSSASDFGFFMENTIDFTEGSSSVLFSTNSGDELFLFTTADIPLQAGTTYNVQYSYKYLSTGFDSNDNITFRIISGPTVNNPFVNTVNIQNNDWNTVQFQFTPSITDSDYSVEIYIQGETSDFGDYEVLFDDVRIVEDSTLSTVDSSLDETLNLIKTENKVLIQKPEYLKIVNVKVFSILGAKQKPNISDNFSEVDITNLSSGLYIFNIETNEGKVSKKILID